MNAFYQHRTKQRANVRHNDMPFTKPTHGQTDLFYKNTAKIYELIWKCLNMQKIRTQFCPVQEKKHLPSYVNFLHVSVSLFLNVGSRPCFKRLSVTDIIMHPPLSLRYLQFAHSKNKLIYIYLPLALGHKCFCLWPFLLEHALSLPQTNIHSIHLQVQP